MIDIAICDDDIGFLRYLSNVLYKLGEDQGITVEVESFQDSRLLVERIRQGRRYDLIYLDIQMKEMGGLETAKKIREMDWTVQLVYITYYVYALVVFKVYLDTFLKERERSWAFLG